MAQRIQRSILASFFILAGPVAGLAVEAGEAGRINEFITMSALVDTRFRTGRDFAGERVSELELYKAELGIDLKPTDWALGHVLFQYKEANAEVELDEAFLTVGHGERTPLQLTAGKFTLPFGEFASDMITDPLTKELGEIKKTGVSLGLARDGAPPPCSVTGARDTSGPRTRSEGSAPWPAMNGRPGSGSSMCAWAG